MKVKSIKNVKKTLKEAKKQYFYISYDMNDEIIMYFNNEIELCHKTNLRKGDIYYNFKKRFYETDGEKYIITTFQDIKIKIFRFEI